MPANPADNLANAQEAVRVAHLKHADNPRVSNRFNLAFAEWRVHYEAKAALRDRNPSFASKLLPKGTPIVSAGVLLPLTPAGVRYALDEAGPNTVTLTVDVAGAVALAVQPPTGAAFNVTPIAGATRQTATFPAVGDGLYKLTLKVNGTSLATVYVSVQRKLDLAFREWSRQTAFAFKNSHRPQAPTVLPELLALIYASEAAAATGQVDLYADVISLANAVTKAPHPVALFPRG